MVIYLDCAATTPVDPEVLEVVNHYMVEEFGNAGSRHLFGAAAKRGVERAREQIAEAVACDPSEVIFTSGATESNNLAILGLADEGERTGRKHIVSTEIEHKSVLEPLRHLASRRGFEVTLVPPNSGGWVDPKALVARVRRDTLLVSIMSVNNETGVIQPIQECSEALRAHEAYLHVDAAQALGKVTHIEHSRIDLLSISGHKVFGPKGVGSLVMRRRAWEDPPLAPIMFGGGQERGLRPGTLPVAIIAGLGKAIEMCVASRQSRSLANQAARQSLRRVLLALGARVVGDEARSVESIITVEIPGLDGEAAMVALRDYVAISNGSACTSSSRAPSHVFSAMGYEAERTGSILRLSWSHNTQASAIEGVFGKLSTMRYQEGLSRDVTEA
ncbi:MAG: aminotransferase class V-fold PLP-dependent enzyme [Planctomycetes bacterium]|nr:aminotransferase class V-fold PLP-dependent enzyme [Planctomycetota bacterium]